MKNILAFVLILLMVSCDDYNTVNRYTQFTRDDLSFLYFDSDTVVFNGSDIIFTDTISFLFNGTDIVKVPVYTKIEASYFPFSPGGKGTDIQGESTLEFNPQTGFKFAEVRLTRDDINKVGSYKEFAVGLYGKKSYTKDIKRDFQIPLDTALVLGVLYNNVFKIVPDSIYQSDSKSIFFTNIKSIYFAKKFGFIKIETVDGKSMERVLPGNLDLGY